MRRYRFDVDFGLRPTAAAWPQHAYSTVKQTPSDFNNIDRFGCVAACSAYILPVSLSLLFLLFLVKLCTILTTSQKIAVYRYRCISVTVYYRRIFLILRIPTPEGQNSPPLQCHKTNAY